MRWYRHPASRLLASLLHIGAALIAGSAQAREACPDGRESIQGQDLVEHEAWLARHKARCAGDPAFLAWHGALLNRIGRYDLAVEQLERALMIEPALMGARLDFAEALAAVGDRVTARQLLRDVLAQPDIPLAAAERARLVLRSLDGLIDSRPQPDGFSAAVRLGHDSNLNRATRLHSLSLTMAAGDIVLPLDESSRARAGTSRLVELEGHLTRPVAGGKYVRFNAELHHRKGPAADLDYTQTDLAAHLDQAAEVGGRPIGLLVAGGGLNYGGDEIYRYLRGGLETRGFKGPCDNRLGADIEWRRQMQTGNGDYQVAQLKSAWVCGRERPLVVQWALGRENGEANHPGGGAWLLGGRLAQTRPLGPGQLEAELRYAGRRDDEGYSPLLQNDAELNVHTFSLRVEYRQNLDRHWQLLADAEIMEQRSNLELFRLGSVVGHLGMRWHW